MNFRFSSRNLDTTRIKVHKNKLDHGSNSNVIYKLNYVFCDVSYVNQTSKQ